MTKLKYCIVGLSALCTVACSTTSQLERSSTADEITARYAITPDQWGFRYLPVVVQDSVKGGRMVISRDWYTGHHLLHIDGQQVGLDWEARLVAERFGKARMDFLIHVPRPAHGHRWKLQVTPMAEVDTRMSALQPVQVNPQAFDDGQANYRITDNDTLQVLAHGSGNHAVTYHYSGLIDLPRYSRTFRIYLDAVMEKSGRIRSLPTRDTLEYRIASLTDYCNRRIKHIVVEQDSMFEKRISTRLVFKQGSASIDRQHPENQKNWAMFKEETDQLLKAQDRILKEVVLTAACSPEGAQDINDRLGVARGNAVKKLLILENIFPGREIKVNSISENWEGVYRHLASMNLSYGDSLITALQAIPDVDRRSWFFSQQCPALYQQFYADVFPQLREVQFNCHFRSAEDKIKIVTSDVDEPYMQALRWMDQWEYGKAIEVLRPYQDYNTAICLLCLNNNNEAIHVLNKLPVTAQTHYLLAIAYYRIGESDRAARLLQRSFRLDGKLKLRVGHDPEVTDLIQRYELHKLR